MKHRKNRTSHTARRRKAALDAESYNLLQAAALIKLFKEGRALPSGPIDPSAVLDRDEWVSVLSDAKRRV